MASKKKGPCYQFEDDCEDELKDLCKSKGRMFYKFPDAKSSRGHVPPQPGEFMILLNGGALLVECKTSEKDKSLRSCASSHIRSTQIGYHRRWYLAGNYSVFVFWSIPDQSIEVWDGAYVATQRTNGKPLDNTCADFCSRFFIGGKSPRTIVDLKFIMEIILKNAESKIEDKFKRYGLEGRIPLDITYTVDQED